MLDFITKHFAALSAFAIGVASTTTMLFLSPYLSVFDWSLIWLVEYGDVGKFILIGVGLLGSILAVLVDKILKGAKPSDRLMVSFACSWQCQ
jgi:hypothetical protein